MPWLTSLAPGQSLTHYPCSSLLVQMFENNRVKFYMQTEVSELRAQEGKVGFSLLLPLLPTPLPASFPVLRNCVRSLTHSLSAAAGGGAEEQQSSAGRRLRGRHR